MRRFIIMIAAGLIWANALPTLADCGSSVTLIQIGSVSDDPEKDTFGITCTVVDIERTSSVTRPAQTQIMPVGSSTGNPEKDSFGYTHVANPQ